MYKLVVVFVALLAVALAEPEAKPQLPVPYGMNPYHQAVAPFNYGLHPEVKSHVPAAYGVNPYHHSVAPFNYAHHPHGDVLKHYSTFHDVTKYGAYPYNKFDAYHHPAQYYGAHGMHAHPLHHEAYTAGYPYHAGAFHHAYNSALVQPKY